ncbi:DUF3572 domain-containing protein [Aureimonas ureilytica]|uniref:DUF3572 domain-containing protein n=1 Tax=Aureimonas ureilytica TaxID=401562 RepID=UPI00039BB448|nr:DUF3572 domain-containing protein [Aureimonas ureilytica]
MLERRGQKFGSGKDAETIGVEALSFMASNPEVLRRFLDVTGMEARQLREAASKPSFFVGLLDFILAHEPTVLDFAAAAELDPAEIGMARERLAAPRS